MAVIGFIGRIAAGKDTAAEYVRDRTGAHLFVMSDLLRERAARRGLEPDREHLSALSAELEERRGPGALAEEVAHRIEALDPEVPAVVVGIRSPADVHTLRERFGDAFRLVHVRLDDPRVRFERAQQRDADRDPDVFEAFRRRDEHEARELGLSRAVALADTTVFNHGPLHRLREQLDQQVVQYLTRKEPRTVEQAGKNQTRSDDTGRRGGTIADDPPLVAWLEDLDSDDTAQVGGKNSSLGEMIGALQGEGIRVPEGFATTAHAYRRFLEHNELQQTIEDALSDLADDDDLQRAGQTIRQAMNRGDFPEDIEAAVREAYDELAERRGEEEPAVAVRSSATAEDLPDASFAGQQESFLNVSGADDLLDACRRCYASLFTDRAISYREQQGFDHLDVALSVGVQVMVRADEAGAGVAFSIDTDTGFPRMVLINAAWGLGENVVQGTIEPDQYRVFKPFLEPDPDGGSRQPIVQRICGSKERTRVYAEGGETTDVDTPEARRDRLVLTDALICELARAVVAIEEHYGAAMDVEWAIDGEDGPLYIVQARPETVQSQREQGALKTWTLREQGERLLTGLAIGQAIASGPVCRIESPDQHESLEEGAVLVTEMTDPDWVPLMKRASAIVTDQGGRTSHAAIVSRELGVPAIVGAGDATSTLSDGQAVTVDCAEGDEGVVYDGELDFDSEQIDLDELPAIDTTILMNIGSPTAALTWWRLPVQGVGLARMEYLINSVIQVHPMALVRFDEVDDDEARERIEALTRRYDDRTEYFTDQLAQGIALVAAAQYPDPVIVRTSDFKSNEYADLIGGRGFEPEEANPMLGWRGASRYDDDDYREGFALECEALRRVRGDMGFRNVVVMIPFCRTPEEADGVLGVMAEHGLERGEDGLQIYVMAEIPSNIIEADAFAERFDGFSIGSNDLTQLCLGVGRDSEKLRHLFDERSPTVKWMITELVRKASEHDRPVGLCGQGPSDHPELAEFLVQAGLSTISVNPDSVARVIEHVARAEGEQA